MSVLVKLKNYNNSPLFTQEEIQELNKLNLSETIFDNPQFINNLVSLKTVYEFEKMISILKEEEDIEKFMLKSVIFDNPRKIVQNNYIKLLKAPRVLTGFYKCPNCGCDNVQTRTQQTRSGDESSTDINTCQDCGKVWRKS